MGRQTLIDGTAQNTSAYHAITYDKNGNRLTDTSYIPPLYTGNTTDTVLMTDPFDSLNMAVLSSRKDDPHAYWSVLTSLNTRIIDAHISIRMNRCGRVLSYRQESKGSATIFFQE